MGSSPRGGCPGGESSGWELSQKIVDMHTVFSNRSKDTLNIG